MFEIPHNFQNILHFSNVDEISLIKSQFFIAFCSNYSRTIFEKLCKRATFVALFTSLFAHTKYT